MGGRALKQIEKKAGGLVAKIHLLPPTSTETEEGRGGRRRRLAGGPRRPWAMVADGRRGKRGMEARGFDPPPSISREEARREGSHGGGRRPSLADAVAAL